MKLGQRSYPHPVLGNGDDVPDYGFQVAIEWGIIGSDFALNVAVQCSSPTLLKQVKNGQACYAVQVECGRTLFRRSYHFGTPVHRIAIPLADLNGVVEITPLAVATKRISPYRVDGANAAYAGTTFAVEAGDVLAVADYREEYLDRDRDALRRVGSIIKIVRSDKTGDHPMRVAFDTDKIAIQLCEADYLAYHQLTHQPHLRSLLATTLVLPVLVQAVIQLEQHADQGCKWVEIVRRRMEEENMGTDPIEVAQKLFGDPVRRAFQSAQAALVPTAGEE